MEEQHIYRIDGTRVLCQILPLPIPTNIPDLCEPCMKELVEKGKAK